MMRTSGRVRRGHYPLCDLLYAHELILYVVGREGTFEQLQCVHNWRAHLVNGPIFLYIYIYIYICNV